MGSFCGHAFPGSAFILVGLWWTVQILRRYYKSTANPEPLTTSRTKKPFHSMVTFPVTTRCGEFDVEVLVVFCISLMGVLFEFVIVNPSGNHEVTSINIQHATMYIGFCLAFLSVLILPKVKVIPDDASYFLLAIAFVNQSLIFQFHKSGSGAVHGLMHALLLYPIRGCALATVGDMLYRKWLLVSLARPYFLLLQGLWFWQVGLTLYPPHTNFWGLQDLEFEDEGSTVMVQTCVFTWYMMGVFVFMLVCWVGMGAYYGSKLRKSEQPLKQQDGE